MSTDDFFDRTEFIQYFRDETEELLQTLDSDLLRLEAFVDHDELDADIIASLFRALHTVKGSAGMLDFKDVAAVAHKLENVFDLLRKDRMPLSEQCINLLFEGRDLLTGLVHAAVGDGSAPGGIDDYITRLDGFALIYESTAAVIDGGERAAAQADAPVEAIADAEVQAFEAEIARLLAHNGGGAEGSTGDVNADEAQAAMDALLGAAAAAAFIPEPEHESDGATTSVPSAKPSFAATAAAASAPAAPTVPSIATTNGAKNADADAAKRPAAGKNQTIRVDIERLDSLLNLVGELVINRTRISDIANTLARSVGGTKGSTTDGVTGLAKDLAESSALLARTTNEIQESIMKVRMVPIGQVFDRFPRMVRDLAKARGKEIKLEISGAETDLDKTIVDEVGEPLMHLIRNCIDHGIERADAREKRGKSRSGTIKLNAFHEGNQVIIEVNDDGGGVDLVRVRERGIKQGLIAESDKLTDREIIDLIFTPGFSTAEAVTDVSGRGVGMDVVKKNILRLKGVFEVDSVYGSGTKFTMKLPLTLAIIQALLVRVADELYSIPLDSVIESQRIDTSEVRTVHGGEVITLRGRVVPLIRVGEFFQLANARDPDKVMIVIVGLQGRQVGLVVDSFQGEQEIVIKPLSDVIGRIAGISGATILGNGSISLIIDVHSLVAGAYQSGRAARAEFSGV